LAPEPEQAAGQYEHLRRKIIKFFAWEQCAGPEDLADECLDRVARKIEDGVEIQSVSGYAAGVARLMVKEQQARRRREQEVLQEFSHWRDTAGSGEDLERAVADLNICLERFSPDQRRLILRYYEGDHALRIENRRVLAEELSLLPNALRNRAMRLRGLLETCMSARVALRDGSLRKTTKSEDARK
jgi:DNA-directed RNA polymerase specialized sigma24 family protein